ncbi:imm11 family protein [Paenibacillus terreus]
MKIWKISAGYKTLNIDVIDELAPEIDDILRSISFAREIKHEWEPLGIHYEKDKGKHTDFPRYAPGRLVFSDKSISVLSLLISELVEFLPLKDEKYNFSFCNVLNVLDCVDQSLSVPIIKSNRVFDYSKMYLHEDMLKEHKRHIFKIPELIRTKVYVSDEFRNAVIDAGLKGLDFDLVWDSEFTKEDELEQQQKYEQYLADLERNKGPEMGWNTAMNLLDEGKEVASAHWKLKKDNKGELLVGQLTLNCEYEFAELIFIPPLLLDLKWHEA